MSIEPEINFISNQINDYAFRSKLTDTPIAKRIGNIPMLFYKGHHWNINLILGEMSSFDTDVYAVLQFNDDILDTLIDQLVKEEKLSLTRLSFRYIKEAGTTTWTSKTEFYKRGDSVQEEFVTWLIEDLKFEFFR